MSPGPRLLKIWIKPYKGAPMKSVETAEIREGKGLVGNANQGGKRQVTIIDWGAWRGMTKQLGESVDPSSRRANLLTEGIALEGSRGRVLRIGECRFRIWLETKPCERMEEARPGLRGAMQSSWRGGVCSEALDSGTIRVGDPVAWEEPSTAPEQ